MLTYGDGVSDVDIRKLVEFHRSHGNWPRSPPLRQFRFGVIESESTGRVTSLGKGKDRRRASAGFFVLNRRGSIISAATNASSRRNRWSALPQKGS